jgi:hypothetical protein
MKEEEEDVFWVTLVSFIVHFILISRRVFNSEAMLKEDEDEERQSRL